VLQFVADAKLLYDIDVVRLGTRLLRLLEALLRETASRSDVKDDIQKFHSASEDVGEEERNGICTYKLSCIKLVYEIKMIANSGFPTALECIKFFFGRDFSMDPTWGAYDAPPDLYSQLVSPIGMLN